MTCVYERLGLPHEPHRYVFHGDDFSGGHVRACPGRTERAQWAECPVADCALRGPHNTHLDGYGALV